MGMQIPVYQSPTYQPPPMRNLVVQPTVAKSPIPANKENNSELLNKLIGEMADLRVQITNAPVK